MSFGLLLIYNFAFNYVTGWSSAAVMRGWSDGEERVRDGAAGHLVYEQTNMQKLTDRQTHR